MLGKLRQLCEVNSKFDLVEHVVAWARRLITLSGSSHDLCVLLLTTSLLHDRERNALVDRQLAGKFIKLLFEALYELFRVLFRVLKHLCAPVLVDGAEVLKIELLDH